AQGPTIAQNFIKRAAYRSLYNTLDEQLDFESYGQGVCRTTEDHKEGVASFMEKRPAVYRGR
ncbi:MAG: 2-(1,2-epoxy-1,2-dihydrophenyl)acetyl-CoA isomerase, partial [Dehalococcoidia bacterium]|nr:2-(1,2-epoxy-1,2-dihydrophenyl)acetyl-CoA isomerase [Dehalococcoidia bacterium]